MQKLKRRQISGATPELTSKVAATAVILLWSVTLIADIDSAKFICHSRNDTTFTKKLLNKQKIQVNINVDTRVLHQFNPRKGFTSVLIDWIKGLVLNFGVNLWCYPKIKWPIVYLIRIMMSENLSLVDVSGDTEEPGEIRTSRRRRVHVVERWWVGNRWKVVQLTVTVCSHYADLQPTHPPIH